MIIAGFGNIRWSRTFFSSILSFNFLYSCVYPMTTSTRLVTCSYLPHVPFTINFEKMLKQIWIVKLGNLNFSLSRVRTDHRCLHLKFYSPFFPNIITSGIAIATNTRIITMNMIVFFQQFVFGLLSSFSMALSMALVKGSFSSAIGKVSANDFNLWYCSYSINNCLNYCNA